MPQLDRRGISPAADEVESLLAASQALIAVTVASLSELDVRLSLMQFRALVVLDTEGSMNATALASRLQVNPSTVTRLSDRLIETGQLHRAQNPVNRREVLLAASARGRRNVERVLGRRRRDLEAVLARLDPAARRGTVTAFRRFAEAVHATSYDFMTGDWPLL